MKTYIVAVACCVALSCCALMPSQTARAQENDEFPFEEEMLVVTGTLVKVKMTNLPNNPWTEMAVQDKDGTLYILIGSKAALLPDLVGQTITVKGYTKPEMMVKGEVTTVIEISEITASDKRE